MNNSNFDDSNSTQQMVNKTFFYIISFSSNPLLSPQNYTLSTDQMDSLQYFMSGVLIFAVSIVGIIGNILLLILVTKQVCWNVSKSYTGLSIIYYLSGCSKNLPQPAVVVSHLRPGEYRSTDCHPVDGSQCHCNLQMYLLPALCIFSLPKFFSGSNFLSASLPYHILPFAHVGMVRQSSQWWE